jgi:hypothetical protein
MVIMVLMDETTDTEKTVRYYSLELAGLSSLLVVEPELLVASGFNASLPIRLLLLLMLLFV